MPVELQVIRASEFVCLDANEHLDFEASRKALQGLAQACVKRGLDRALLDLRGLPILPKPHFNITELAALVGAFRSAGFTRQQRLAILHEHDVHGIVRNFTFFSRLRGLQVQAFRDFERAMRWLAEKEATACPPGAEVPIAKPAKAGSKKQASNSTVTAHGTHGNGTRNSVHRTTKPRPTRRVTPNGHR
jgi:hypothetical protein